MREYKINESTTAIHGANSPETAVVVDDYPYGFRLRCKIRYWVERTKFGERLCTQTTNPKKAGEFWNKPKKSTYTDIECLIRNEENGYISSAGKHLQWEPETMDAFIEKYNFDVADPYVANVQRMARIIAKANSVLTVEIRPASLNAEEREASKRASEEAQRKAFAYGVYCVDKKSENIKD